MELAHMTLHVTTTRDIARQLLRHRSFSFQEFSQRYQNVDQVSAFTREARSPSVRNRQDSLEIEDEKLQSNWQQIQQDVWQVCKSAYDQARFLGIAREQARCLLPEGLTGSSLYVTGSVRSWIHYIQLRCANGTQKEHQQLAEAIKAVFIQQFPVISATLNWTLRPRQEAALDTPP